MSTPNLQTYCCTGTPQRGSFLNENTWKSGMNQNFPAVFSKDVTVLTPLWINLSTAYNQRILMYLCSFHLLPPSLCDTDTVCAEPKESRMTPPRGLADCGDVCWRDSSGDIYESRVGRRVKPLVIACGLSNCQVCAPVMAGCGRKFHS